MPTSSWSLPPSIYLDTSTKYPLHHTLSRLPPTLRSASQLQLSKCTSYTHFPNKKKESWGAWRRKLNGERKKLRSYLSNLSKVLKKYNNRGIFLSIDKSCYRLHFSSPPWKVQMNVLKKKRKEKGNLMAFGNLHPLSVFSIFFFIRPGKRPENRLKSSGNSANKKEVFYFFFFDGLSFCFSLSLECGKHRYVASALFSPLSHPKIRDSLVCESVGVFASLAHMWGCVSFLCTGLGNSALPHAATEQTNMHNEMSSSDYAGKTSLETAKL